VYFFSFEILGILVLDEDHSQLERPSAVVNITLVGLEDIR
jgi:hypothetical protein